MAAPLRFGPYHLLKRIAAGGMGEVFLARREGPEGFEKLVALKRLLPQLRQQPEFINMFFDEARIAAALDHPNIGQIYDLGDISGELLIVMELVHGASVRDLIAVAAQTTGALPLGVVCRIVADAAGALDFAHRATDAEGRPLRLVHRDVSPHNVMVGYDGTVKLIDFGIAKAANKLARTATGVVRGKIAYMSPEQARGEELDGRSDVFGLGIVAYELLLLRRLFRRETDAATVRAVLAAEVVAPSSIEPRLPQALDAIIIKALARDRADRFGSAAELKQALEKLISSRRLAATSAHVAQSVRALFPFEAQSPLNVKQAERPAGVVLERATDDTGITDTDRDDAPTISTSQPDELRSVLESALALDPRLTSSGVLFRAVLSACEELGGVEARQRVESLVPMPSLEATRRRPTRQLAELLQRALEVLAKHSVAPLPAMETVGSHLFDGLQNTAQGRALKKADRTDEQPLWSVLLELLQSAVAPGERQLDSSRPRFARVRFRDEPLPMAIYVGCFRRLLYRSGAYELKAQLTADASSGYDLVLRW